MQGRWLPDHLHWAGIDQMVTQGAAITSDAVTSAEAMSDGGLQEWVIHTLASCHHQALPTLQLPHDMATAQHQQISTFATTAGIGAAAEASDQDSALTTAAASPSIEDDAALGEVLASQQWFDSFHLPSAYEERTSNTGTSQSGDDGHGIGHGRCCWGPQPPPQYTAMLCGELSLAVMSGVAGKSLIKEVCPCNCTIAVCCQSFACKWLLHALDLEQIDAAEPQATQYVWCRPACAAQCSWGADQARCTVVFSDHVSSF